MRIQCPGCNCAACQFVTKGTVFLQAGKDIEMASDIPVRERMSNGEFFLMMDALATVHLEPHQYKWH